jgi:hypothetical protein
VFLGRFSGKSLLYTFKTALSGEQKMKTKKIVAITLFAVMAVALVVTSAYAFHINGFGTSEVSTILSYPAQSSVTAAQTDSSIVTYGEEPVLTTASEVTSPIYYPTCICGYGYYGTIEGHDGYTCAYGPGYGYGGHGRGGCGG